MRGLKRRFSLKCLLFCHHQHCHQTRVKSKLPPRLDFRRRKRRGTGTDEIIDSAVAHNYRFKACAKKYNLYSFLQSLLFSLVYLSPLLPPLPPPKQQRLHHEKITMIYPGSSFFSSVVLYLRARPMFVLAAILFFLHLLFFTASVACFSRHQEPFFFTCFGENSARKKISHRSISVSSPVSIFSPLLLSENGGGGQILHFLLNTLRRAWENVACVFSVSLFSVLGHLQVLDFLCQCCVGGV